MRDQFKHNLQGGEGFGPPVDRNEGKESMFNFIPFAGRRWIMSHGNRQVFFSGQFLELFLPEPISCPIRATSISSNQQLLFARIERFATGLPPSSNTLYRELGGIMIDADIDKSTLVNQIIHPIRDGLAIGQRKKIIDVHIGLLSFGLPFSPVVLKIAKQFLLLAIDRDDRGTFLLKLLARAIDVSKLSIPIHVRFPLNA